MKNTEQALKDFLKELRRTDMDPDRLKEAMGRILDENTSGALKVKLGAYPGKKEAEVVEHLDEKEYFAVNRKAFEEGIRLVRERLAEGMNPIALVIAVIPSKGHGVLTISGGPDELRALRAGVLQALNEALAEMKPMENRDDE